MSGIRANDAIRCLAAAAIGLLVAWPALAAAPAPAAPEAAEAPAAQPPPAAAPEAEAPAAEMPAEGKAADGAGSDAQFFSELGYKDTASASDAARAMAIFVSEGQWSGGDFIADKKYLRDKGITIGWLEGAAATDPVSKGRLAGLICRALGIKGGMWMRLFGPVPRYALRECVYLDLMKGGAEYQHVTGGELVGVIDRADWFRLKKAGGKPAELQGRPSGAKAGTE